MYGTLKQQNNAIGVVIILFQKQKDFKVCRKIILLNGHNEHTLTMNLLLKLLRNLPLYTQAHIWERD